MRELFLTLVSRGLPAVGAVLFNVVVIRILDIDAAGGVFYWITNLYLIGFVATLGLDIFLLKKISIGMSSLVSEQKRTVFAISSLVSFVVIEVVGNSAVLIIASLPFFNMIAINSKILRAQGNYFLAGIYEQTSIFTVAAFVVWIYSNLENSLGVQGVVFVLLAASIGVCVLTELKVDKNYRLVNFKGFKVFRYEISAASFMMIPIITYGSQWMPVYFLRTLGDSEVSIYSISVRCASLLAFLALSMDSYLLPKIAKLNGEESHEEINDLILKFKRISLAISVFLGLIYVFVGSVAVTSWAGDGYERSYYVAYPIIAMYFLSFISGPYQSYLLMSGGEQYVNWANILSFVIVAILCVILNEVRLLGAGGAACVILVGRGASIIYLWYVGRRHIRERILQAG